MYCSVKKIQRGRRGHSKQNVLNYNKKILAILLK
jgi:hypothetical protein